MSAGRVIVRNTTRDLVLAADAELARGPIRRAVGLMGRRRWDGSDGLVLERCGAIHTFFMRMPIDVLYLDEAGRVLRAQGEMRPWRLGPISRRARTVIELPTGTLSRVPTLTGDQVAVEPALS